MNDKPSITIKKYANRRLYNTATSTYVTLEDLSAMVKEGLNFNVYDAKTSEDITRSVLTQIIVEEEGKTGQQNLLPISFLRQLISFYGDNLQWMVPKYLEQSMEALTCNQEKIREYFSASFGNIFPFGTTLEEMGKQNMAMFERTMSMFSPQMFNPFNLTSSMETEEPCACADCTCEAPAAKAAPAPKAEPKIEPKAEVKETKQEAPTASVTNLKPRESATPMPSVQAATLNTGADDMQQKIANLQRQLADLAKSRA